MRRREFITLLGGATAPGPSSHVRSMLRVPVVGFLSGASLRRSFPSFVTAFRRGLE